MLKGQLSCARTAKYLVHICNINVNCIWVIQMCDAAENIVLQLGNLILVDNH